jgi:ankyrin repeat protein
MRAPVRRSVSLALLVAVLPAFAQKPEKKPVDPARASAARAALEAKGQKLDPERFAGRVRNGDVESVRLYLDAGLDPDVGDGDTPPLEEASTRGHAGVVELLLGAGADPNRKNGNGMTPLQAAVVQSQAACVKALVAAGANPNLAYKGTGDTPLIRASNVGSPETLLVLLEGGADPNRGDGNGSTVLLWEAQKGNVETVKALLGRGADPNVTSAGGGTPLLMAVAMDKVDVARLLLQAGADAKTNHAALVASAQSPEMKKLLANPPPGKKPGKPAAKKGGTKP